MKKFLSVVLAVMLVLACAPLTFAALAVDEVIAGPQNTDSKPISVVYMKDGVKTYLGHYANADSKDPTSDAIDVAMDAMKTLYEGPLADASLTDTNGNGLSDELYAAAGSPVIKLNRDYDGYYARPNWCTESGGLYNADKVVTFIVDGDNGNGGTYTLSYGKTNDYGKKDAYTNTAFKFYQYYNLELKNLKMEFYNTTGTGGNLQMEYTANITTKATKSYFTFDNVTWDEFNSVAGDDNSGAVFKLKGSDVASLPHTVDITIKDSKINTESALGVYAYRYMTANFKLINSTWTQDGEHSQKNNNDTIFAAQANGTINIDLDATSSLISARTSTAPSASIFRCTQTTSKITAKLAKGSTIALIDTCTGTAGRVFFAGYNNYTIEDNGCVFKASKENVAKGVALPQCFEDASGNAHIWMANGVTCGSTYTATVAGDVVFTHVADNDPAANPSNIATATVGGVTKYYTSVVDAANESDDGNVTIIKPCTIAGGDITKAVTIDCGNFEVTVSAQINAKVTDGTVKFKNGTIKVTSGGFETCEGFNSTLAFEAITMTVSGNLRLVGSGSKYTFKDCAITGTDNDGVFFCRATGPADILAKGTIEFDNSTLTQQNGQNGDHIGNNGVIHMVTKSGYTAKTAEYTITLKNGSVLENACNNNDSKVASIIVAEEVGGDYNNKVNLSIDETSALKLRSTSTALTGASFVNYVGSSGADGKSDWSIVMKGKMVATAAIVKTCGVTFPTIDGDWMVGTTKLETATYKDENAAADVEFGCYMVDMTQFDLLNTATLKSEGSVGVAFKMEIDQTIVDLLGDSAVYGIAIVPDSYAAIHFDIGRYTETSAIMVTTNKAGLIAGEGKSVAYLGIKDIPLDGGEHVECLSISVRGFIRYTAADGTQVLLQTDNIVTTSLYELAVAAAANGQADNEIVKQIIMA